MMYDLERNGREDPERREKEKGAWEKRRPQGHIREGETSE